MKKVTLLLIAVISCIACSKEENTLRERDIFENLITPEYSTLLGFSKDYFIKDGEVYFIYSGNRTGGEFAPSIRKINKNGETSVLMHIDGLFFDEMGMALSPAKDSIYLVTDTPSSVGTSVHALSFTSNKEKSYPTRSQMLTDIKHLEDDKYIVVGDRNSRLLLFSSKAKTFTYIAGGNAKFIKDGKGEDAFFKRIDRMLIINKAIYVVDSGNTLRKVVYDKTSNSYNVTTLVANFSENIKDIFSDEDNNLLVLADKIYKFDPSNNTLHQYFKDDTEERPSFDGKISSYNVFPIKLPQPNSYTQISWGAVEKIFIDKNDIYIDNTLYLFKISNYKEIFVK